MQVINVFVLLLSTFSTVREIRGGDIDLNVCNPLTLQPVPPPPPALPPSYSTKLEWKWVDKNETISVSEVHDGINNMGSQTIHMLGQATQIIYDYSESQYIVYNQDAGCSATGLGSIAFYDNKIWLTSTSIIYKLAREGTAPYIGETVVRNVTVGHWQACLFFFQSNITVEIDMYFSVTGWAMAISAPNQLVPVRFEMKGSHNYQNGSDVPATYFHVIGDFVDFSPNPLSNLEPLQPPPGTFCQGRQSRKPINLLPSSFSLTMENIDMDYFKITYESVWFHSEKKLIRRDFKDSEAKGSDPDPLTDILDYNLGVHYNIDTYTVTCEQISEVTTQDLYAKPHGDNTVVMQSALDFFHVQNANIQYVGTRTARSVACDVWVGVYLDVESNRNVTIEWYFTKANWVEAVDLVVQPAALIRMDIWQGGSNKPIVHNIYHLNPEAPPQDVFNVAPCYQSSQKKRILIPFKVVNDGKIDKVSARYLKDVLHDVITNRTYIDPLRLTDTILEFEGSSKVYMAATLLERPPLTSKNLYPQPSPSSLLHDLSETYFFLNGLVNQPLTLKINSTIDNKPVVIQATGLFNIDYPSDSSSTTATTTQSTTEATPPLPTSAPTTTKQQIPTPGKEQLKTSTTATTITTASSTTKSSTLILKSTDTSSPTTRSTSLETQTPCTCPKISCPTVSQLITEKPAKCPSLPPPSPCPTNKQSVPGISQFSMSPTTKSTTVLSTKSASTSTTVSSTKTTLASLTRKPQPQSTTVVKKLSSFSPHSSDLSYSTNKYLGQKHTNNPDTKGMSSGVVAAIAIGTLIIGLVCGVLLLKLYQIRRNKGSEDRNILLKYLDDDLKY